ncbi:MAG: hypothetical protein EXS33_07465, partial [Pedosphaera sp.]|nr:hypothetical protein [Pedosphaera sp.]
LGAAAGLGAATNESWFARAWQTDEGLPDNVVVGITQAPDGFLWVATQGGLVRFDGNQFRDFAPVTEAGAPSGLMYGVTADRRGRLWVTKDGGVLAGVEQGRTSSWLLRRGAANPRASAPGRRAAYYSHVPPGRYRFRVTAADQHGNWPETGAALDIEVLPHFWQTWWFQVLAALALLGTVGGLVRYLEIRKMRGQVEQAEREGAVERERARIAKDIHDDLGASLTEITLLSELAQGGEAPGEVQADMRKIAARPRHLTQSLDATVWAVNPRNDTLESLVTYTCQHAEDFLKAAGIRCRLEVPDRLPARALTATARHNVFLIVKEALHNVVKHAAATGVTLRLTVRPDGLTLVIEDNGRGFDPARPATC